MKKLYFYVIVHLCSFLLLSPLYSSTTLSLTPLSNIIAIIYKDQLAFNSIDTLYYTFSFLHDETISSSLSYKFISEHPSYNLAIGNIKGDTRIKVLNGTFFSSPSTQFSYRHLQVREGEVRDSSLAISIQKGNFFFNPFIITSLEEGDKYLTSGLIVDHNRISSGISYLYSFERETDREKPIIQWNKKALISGFSTYIRLYEEGVPLLNRYFLDYSYIFSASFPLSQAPSKASYFSASIKEDRNKELNFSYTHHPLEVYRWDINSGKSSLSTSKIEYNYKSSLLHLTYSMSQEVYEKSIFAYTYTPVSHNFLFEVEYRDVGLDYRTTIYTNEKGKRTHQQRVRLSYTSSPFSLRATYSNSSGKGSFKGEVSIERDAYSLFLSVTDKGKVSYSYTYESQRFPFTLSFTLAPKDVVTIKITTFQ